MLISHDRLTANSGSATKAGEEEDIGTGFITFNYKKFASILERELQNNGGNQVSEEMKNVWCDKKKVWISKKNQYLYITILYNNKK